MLIIKVKIDFEEPICQYFEMYYNDKELSTTTTPIEFYTEFESKKTIELKILIDYYEHYGHFTHEKTISFNLPRKYVSEFEYIIDKSEFEDIK